LPFPRSPPECQRLFPGEGACVAYLERTRWGDGFVYRHYGASGEPRYVATRHGVLRSWDCRSNTSPTAGTRTRRSRSGFGLSIGLPARHFSVKKMQSNTSGGSIIYCSGMNPKIQRNFEVFNPCDFIARITQNISDKSFQLVLYYGWYSNKMRGLRLNLS
jgi:hypothetical protein